MLLPYKNKNCYRSKFSFGIYKHGDNKNKVSLLRLYFGNIDIMFVESDNITKMAVRHGDALHRLPGQTFRSVLYSTR